MSMDWMECGPTLNKCKERSGDHSSADVIIGR